MRGSCIASLALAFSALFIARGAFAGPSLAYVAEVTNDLAKKALAEKRILDLEEVLFRIGDDFPELRKTYILMHESKSRQGASFEFPRVIAHTTDARFALAFNGNPDAPGYYEIEMYEFKKTDQAFDVARFVENTPVLADDYQSEAFHFRRIVFQPRPDYRFIRHYAGIDHFPFIGPINETLCQGCHGANIRPNWESYSRWDGAYLDDDTFRTGTKYRLGYKSPEHAGFDLFYTRQAFKGRYRFLQGLKERFVLPVEDQSRVPTSQFTQVAGYLNYRRVAHTILQSKEYDTYKFAIFGALYDCENFEQMLPPALAVEMKASLTFYVDQTRQSYKDDANNYHLHDDAVRIGKFRYLFEGRGISMERWSMSFRRSPYSFVTPGGSTEGFITSLLIDYDPSMEPYRAHKIIGDGSYGVTSSFSKEWTGHSYDMVRDQCLALEKKSCEAFGAKGFQCDGNHSRQHND